MRVNFYIQAYTDITDKCIIGKDGIRIRQLETLPVSSGTTVQTDGLELNKFLVELECFQRYRLRIASALVTKNATHGTILILVAAPRRQPLDYEWGHRANRLFWERQELHEMMSWLSTLGGAFSAMGDYKMACADIASKISLRQMKLAMQLGDPDIVARCRLYLSIAMIQKYHFASAERTVRQVYRQERKKVEPDMRLQRMCLGIWAKLKYEYELYVRHQNRRKA